MSLTPLPPPPPAAPVHSKLAAHQWFESIASPQYVVAPMVDQSELAWRILSRLHGADIAYTPMFHAALFSAVDQPRYAAESFDLSPTSLEGVAPYDRPLIVQFCANNKDIWLAAAQKVVERCDGVDLNLGCPQGIAKKGKYGAFLMEDWDLIGSMISHVHQNLAIPVSAKLRIFPTLTQTLDYATHLYTSGAQLLTVHGRTRESKGHLAGLASWPTIAAIVQRLSPFVPVYANGGVPSGEQVGPCRQETGAQGVMSAEGNLYNPMIFSPANAAAGRAYKKVLPMDMQEALSACDAGLLSPAVMEQEVDGVGPAYAPATFLAAQYLAIVRTLPSTETSTSAVKAHLFKLFRPIWASGKHVDLREALGKVASRGSRAERCDHWGGIVSEMEKRIAADLAAGELPEGSHRLLTHAEVQTLYGGVIPYSHAQPYYRIASASSIEMVKPSEQVVEGGSQVGEDSAAESKRSRATSPEPTIFATDIPVSDSTSDATPSLSKRQKLVPQQDMAFLALQDTDLHHPLRSPGTSALPCTGAPTGAKGKRASKTNCSNVPAAKCPLGACKVCCPVLWKALTPEARALLPGETVLGEGDEDGGMCALHVERAEKDRLKGLEKRAKNSARKLGAKELKAQKKSQEVASVYVVKDN